MGDVSGKNTAIRPKQSALYRWLALILLTVIGLVALISADQSLRLTQQQLQKTRHEKVTRLVQSRLNTAIQIPLNTVASMQAFMLATPSLPGSDSFDRFAANMLQRTPSVGGFAYVDPQRVIRHFYPLSGNEKAIGLDLTTRPAAPHVEKAIRERRLTMNPPAVTVQGRLSTIARMPLYRDDKFLGLVQGVIEIDKVLQLVTADLEDDVRIYLEDAAGKRIWGPTSFPEGAGKIALTVGDTHWVARVWLASSGVLAREEIEDVVRHEAIA